MSGLKATPGPWRVERDNLLPQWGVAAPTIDPLQRPAKLYVAKIIIYSGLEDPAEANAYLIAAAPELYGALVGMVQRYWETYRLGPELRARVEAALAKARGESQ